MSHSLLAALLCIPLAFLPAISRAQEEDQAPDKSEKNESRLKGIDLLRAADAKIAKARTVTFKATTRGVGALSTRSPHATGTVTMIRDAKAAPGFRFSARGPALISGKETAERTFATSFDGRTVRTLHEHEKTVVEAPWSSSTDLMDEGAGWLATWILQWKELITDRFNEPEMVLPNRVDGLALVNGTLCDVIYVDYSELSNRNLFDVWWYLGKDDALPRRIDMHLVGAGGDGFTITEIERIELDAPVSDTQLALAIPEGFKVEKAKEPEGRRGVAIVKAAGPQTSAAAPDWTLKDDTGAEQSLSGYRGKVVVLDFWATWCPPCREVMPTLQKLHEKYMDQGVVILGMNCWESADPAAHMKANKFTYGLILNADDAAKAYGVSAIPTLYVIGKDGKVVYRTVGAESQEALEEAIERALKP